MNMAAPDDRAVGNIVKRTPPESDPTKMDRKSPAGSKDALGAEDVRDDRPSTDDSVVAVMDEESPGLVSE